MDNNADTQAIWLRIYVGFGLVVVMIGMGLLVIIVSSVIIQTLAGSQEKVRMRVECMLSPNLKFFWQKTMFQSRKA